MRYVRLFCAQENRDFEITALEGTALAEFDYFGYARTSQNEDTLEDSVPYGFVVLNTRAPFKIPGGCTLYGVNNKKPKRKFKLWPISF